MGISLLDGKKRWLKINRKYDKDSILGVITDVTKDIIERKKIEKERDYDVLTGLLNRRAFENKLSQLANKKENLKLGAMLMWDLDNLKFINDNYGHNIGDDYLIAFANCLKKFSNKNVISARRSGDEFTTFFHGYDSFEEIEEITEEIRDIIQNTSIDLQGYGNFKLRVSMGKAWFPKDSDDFDKLLHHADSEMYMEKNEKKEIRKTSQSL